ncbi:MAG: sigma-70 family RNA polymerase sigma factor [Blastocatellia bacterium]
MSTPSQPEITQLLAAWSDGDPSALEQLVPLVQAELHRIAKRYIRRGNPGQLLQTSALINEAYLRLIHWKNARWQNRANFFGVAAQLMRRILVDEYREQHSQKRGGDALRVSLTEAEAQSDERSADLVALDDALKSLAQLDERKSRIIELRYFGGLSVEETAEVLQVSARTVKREWSLAQAWLFRELSREDKEAD